jgi:hypothetical protein
VIRPGAAELLDEMILRDRARDNRRRRPQRHLARRQ